MKIWCLVFCVLSWLTSSDASTTSTPFTTINLAGSTTEGTTLSEVTSPITADTTLVDTMPSTTEETQATGTNSVTTIVETTASDASIITLEESTTGGTTLSEVTSPLTADTTLVDTTSSTTEEMQAKGTNSVTTIVETTASVGIYIGVATAVVVLIGIAAVGILLLKRIRRNRTGGKRTTATDQHYTTYNSNSIQENEYTDLATNYTETSAHGPTNPTNEYDYIKDIGGNPNQHYSTTNEFLELENVIENTNYISFSNNACVDNADNSYIVLEKKPKTTT